MKKRELSYPIGGEIVQSWALDGKESSCSAGDLGLTLGREDTLEKEMAT